MDKHFGILLRHSKYYYFFTTTLNYVRARFRSEELEHSLVLLSLNHDLLAIDDIDAIGKAFK